MNPADPKGARSLIQLRWLACILLALAATHVAWPILTRTVPEPPYTLAPSTRFPLRMSYRVVETRAQDWSWLVGSLAALLLVFGVFRSAAARWICAILAWLPAAWGLLSLAALALLASYSPITVVGSWTTTLWFWIDASDVANCLRQFTPTLLLALWYWVQHPHRSGHCQKCGYALTGLPAYHRCPECGTTFGPAERP